MRNNCYDRRNHTEKIETFLNTGRFIFNNSDPEDAQQGVAWDGDKKQVKKEKDSIVPLQKIYFNSLQKDAGGGAEIID